MSRSFGLRFQSMSLIVYDVIDCSTSFKQSNKSTFASDFPVWTSSKTNQSLPSGPMTLEIRVWTRERPESEERPYDLPSDSNISPR